MGAIKHHEIEIPARNPFENCRLRRKEYATVLTEIIEANPNGFVLALNSEWGTGKTTFVKMWKQSLQDNGYQTMYINAWENDLIADPSVAILGELKKLPNKKNKANFNKVMAAGATILKNVLPDLAEAALKKCIGIDGVADGVKNAVKSSTDLLYESVEEYWKKKEGIEEFKKQLGEYLREGELKRPVVFIIDELDRCRPDYAVEFLEKIKHFFSVEGIVFVLALDKKQLGNSIKGFYGSDLIDSEEYLRRFIDIEYRLPEPEIRNYCSYLYDYFGFDEFFKSSERLGIAQLRNDSSNFIEFASALAIKSHLTLRQVEKLFAHSRLSLNSFSVKNDVAPRLFFSLIYLRNHKPDIYKKIQLKEYDYENLVKALSLLNSIKENNRINQCYFTAQWLVSYWKYTAYSLGSLLNDQDANTLNFETELDKSQLITSIKDAGQVDHSGTDILQHLFAKIELYSNLV